MLGWRAYGIKRSDLLIEIGSGNRPHARSNVLCDLGEYGQNARYAGGLQSDIVCDRPFIFGDATRLPFRDSSFDYLIAAHMLEHLEHPEQFLYEAMRVSKRGCIITPSEIFEKMFPEPTHYWYISVIDGKLKIRAKPPDDKGVFGNLFFKEISKNRYLKKYIFNTPDVFETVYLYSDGKIDFEIQGTVSLSQNFETDDDGCNGNRLKLAMASQIRSILGRLVRLLSSRRKVDLNKILACPICGGDAILERKSSVRCLDCGKCYPLKNNRYPIMIEKR